MASPASVEITGIAAGGAGVGRLPDGRVVFVQRTAPGELVDVRVTGGKARWARAELVAIRRAAPARRLAPCPHYERCGGCTLEHIEYEGQLVAKRGIVGDALERIGGLDTGVPEIVASPREFRYRNRVAFTLVRLGSTVVAGFHELNNPARVLDIGAACLLPEEAVAAVWGRLREEWGPAANRLPSGQKLRLTLRGTSGGAVALLVQGGFGAGRAEELLERVEGLAAVWHEPEGGPLRLVAGDAALQEVWEEEELALSGAVFLQVNRGSAALLEEHVLALAMAGGEKRVVDAYCGIGLHARRLARQGVEVVGIELDEAAVREAGRDAPDSATFRAGRVEEVLPEVLPADLVIVNPPRAGLDAAIPGILNGSGARRLIYVSCDPATLARDINRLEEYTLSTVKCFDLFPQTSHVETVAELKKRGA